MGEEPERTWRLMRYAVVLIGLLGLFASSGCARREGMPPARPRAVEVSPPIVEPILPEEGP